MSIGHESFKGSCFFYKKGIKKRVQKRKDGYFMCHNTTSFYIQPNGKPAFLLCAKCNESMPIETLQLTPELQQKWLFWKRDHENWLDSKTGTMIHGGEHLEKQYHQRGQELTKELNQAANGRYTLEFKQSYKYMD